jgi:hypothetical protein
MWNHAFSHYSFILLFWIFIKDTIASRSQTFKKNNRTNFVIYLLLPLSMELFQQTFRIQNGLTWTELT